MAKKVDIPVEVTGAKKARDELKQTGQSVEQLGGAGSKQATGTNQATAATAKNAAAHKKAAPAIKQTAQATDHFDDSAKTALTGILGQFNPMLASLANIAVDVAKGITKVSKALLTMIGVGAAVAVFIAFFQKIRSEIQKTKEEAIEADARIRRMYERVAKERDKGRGYEERVAEALEDAGIYGGGAKGGETAATLMRDKGIVTLQPSAMFGGGIGGSWPVWM